MKKIKTISDLNAIRKVLENDRIDSEDKKVIVKVAMSTCSIATGSKKVISFFREQMGLEAIDSLVVQTGCMGLCHSEPTVIVSVPGKDSVIFGNVTEKKVNEIITSYIKEGNDIEGVLLKKNS
ncbi:MAG: (2Fe-2S) ferredoxin domain-containing protein [Candidatus Delongbacteria bacterium]|nr:(2Fe-2S) ferredoxin domain-containing protein [Candidatus Delongbacteria bacterium]